MQDSEKCQLRADAGGSCDTDHPCSVDLSCVTPVGMASGTCLTDGTMGAACDPKRQTAAGCDPNAGLYCDGTTKTCLSVGYAMAGNPCGSVNHAVVVCTDASTCVGAQGQTPGTCVADAPNGMACDRQNGPSCLPPARCVTGSATATSGVCAVPDPSTCI